MTCAEALRWLNDHSGAVHFCGNKCTVTWSHQGYCQPDGVGEDVDGAKAFLKAVRHARFGEKGAK